MKGKLPQITETAEAAKNLVNTQEATVAGVLILVLVLMAVAIVYLWRALGKKDTEHAEAMEKKEAAHDGAVAAKDAQIQKVLDDHLSDLRQHRTAQQEEIRHVGALIEKLHAIMNYGKSAG